MSGKGGSPIPRLEGVWPPITVKTDIRIYGTVVSMDPFRALAVTVCQQHLADQGADPCPRQKKRFLPRFLHQRAWRLALNNGQLRLQNWTCA